MGNCKLAAYAGFAIFVTTVLAAVPDRGMAQPTQQEVDTLKEEIRRLREQDSETRRKLEALERQIEKLQVAPVTAPAAPAAPAVTATDDAARRALDLAIGELPAPQVPTADLWSRQIGAANLRLMEIAFDAIVAGGSSTATDDEIRVLEGGAHDPKRRGFTLQQAELSLAGAVDPYFSTFAFIVFGTDYVELEEAYFLSSSLPYGLQLKGGYYLTEFGLINPTHSHAWAWVDQPVVNTRMFGGDGLRTPGFRLGWLAPLPWYSEVDLGVQAPNDGLVVSFISDPAVGGRPAVPREVSHLYDLLYSARLYNAFGLGDNTMLLPGLSFVSGPNSTGDGGQTFIFGADLKLRWRPAENFRGWPFFVWQTEAMSRAYTADWYLAGTELADGGGGHSHDEHNHGGGEEPADEDPFPNNLPGGILRDWGLYTQILYGFRNPWAGGLRFEYADASGDSVADGDLVPSRTTPLRGLRYRVSPLLIWQPTEFSRFRLQYNWDYTPWLPGSGTANSVWLSAEVLIGAHPAHTY